MSFTVFRSGLEFLKKVLRYMCSNVVNRNRRGGGGVEVKPDARETPIHATTREVIDYILADDYKVDDDRLPDLENKLSATGKN